MPHLLVAKTVLLPIYDRYVKLVHVLVSLLHCKLKHFISDFFYFSRFQPILRLETFSMFRIQRMPAELLLNCNKNFSLNGVIYIQKITV